MYKIGRWNYGTTRMARLWPKWKRVANVNTIQRMRSEQAKANRAVVPKLSRRGPLTLYEDRRLWDPEGYMAPARSFSAQRHRLKAIPKGTAEKHRGYMVWSGIGFARPSRVLVCVRRKIRREVMFALGHQGKNGGHGQPRRMSEYSDIAC